MNNILENTLYINEVMKYEDTIARYMKFKKENGDKELFLIKEEATDKAYGKGDYVVLAIKNNDEITISIAPNLNIDKVEELNLSFSNDIEIITYKKDDEVFSENFKIHYSKEKKIRI